MARTKRKINPVIPAGVQEVPKRRIYHAGGYARLSVEDSGKPGADTIENQKGLVREYIENQPDMELCGIYCDNGQTGTDFQRPEFERLMEDVRAGKIDCIVVKDLSRFGRNYLETGNYLEQIFPFLDVRFVAVADRFDTLDAERTSEGYIVPLKNIINEAYSKDISRKVGSAYAVKQAKGEFTGTWPAYGYRRCAEDPHRIEPDPETAPVVQDIFKWRLSGSSNTQIMRELNQRGVPSPVRYHYLKGDAKCERYADGQWNMKTIQKILTNEVYRGHMVQGRKRQSFYEGKKQQFLQKSDWVIVHNTHEPLVDETVFGAVQEIMEKRKADYWESYGKRPGTPHILKGLVFCADCGRTMMRYKFSKGGKIGYTYVCRTHKNNPQACPSKSMPEKELISVLWDTLRAQLGLADSLSEKLQKFLLSSEEDRFEVSLKREADAAVQELERAQMLYDRLYPMYAEDKLLTEQEYIRLRQSYRERIRQAETALEAVEEKKKTHTAQTEDNPWLKTNMCFQGEAGLTDEMAHALLERVEIGTDKQVSIKLRYQDEYRRLAELLDAGEVSV